MSVNKLAKYSPNLFIIGWLYISALTVLSFTDNLPGKEKAQEAIKVLDSWYNPDSAFWNTTSWWNSANAMTALINYSQFTGDTTYIHRINYTFTHINPNNFLNKYYDDEGWWALAWIAAFDYLGDKKYLDKSVQIFADMTKGWDENCGGGIYWNKDHLFKNAISNELFISVAIRLHQRGVKQPLYGLTCMDWANKSASWFINSGMINEEGLVNDGLGKDCLNNGRTTWTYNQGVILGAFAELFLVTRDSAYLKLAQTIANAAIKNLTNEDGILTEPNEPNCNQDQVQFKGIFIRNLGYLTKITKEKRYIEFIIDNAQAIWEKNRDEETNQLGLMWSGPFDRGDAARQTSALDALNAAVLFKK